MKKLKYFSLAFLVAPLLAIPATAQRHGMGRMGQMGHRNNTPRTQKKDNDKGKQNPDRDKARILTVPVFFFILIFF